MDKPKLCILSGGFDPLHTGHIKMFEHARSISDKVVVCVNSDEWLIKKKGIAFLDIQERLNIVNHMRFVDQAISFEDDEYGSACNGIAKVVETFGPGYHYMFGNGGDRNINSTPSHEQILSEHLGVEMVYGIGGDYKANSSSWILKRYLDSTQEFEERPWGSFRVIRNDLGYKVKSIVVEPGRRLSLQSHKHRSEHWVVVRGVATTNVETETSKVEQIVNPNESIYIPVGAIHRLSNNGTVPLEIIEVQVGNYLGEDDITRYQDDFSRT